MFGTIDLAFALATVAPVAVQGSPVSDTTLRFQSAAGIELAGTFTAPAGPVRSAAVLLSVAGPDDRDMSIGTRRLYGEWADELAAAGIATLRYDDRGVGGSGGRWLETTFDDRAGDACAALSALRRRAKRAEVGLIGMSEGGGLALRAARRCGKVAFVVLLSTPLRPGRIELAAQVDRLLAMAPFADTVKAAFRVEADRLTRAVALEPPAGGRESVLAVLRGPYGPALLPPFRFVPRDPAGQAEFLLSPWYRSQVGYDVAPDLQRTRLPILGIYGALDRNIDPAANAAILRNSTRATVHYVDSLNHVLQAARTGLPDEYPRLPGGIAPRVTTLVTEWVLGDGPSARGRGPNKGGT